MEITKLIIGILILLSGAALFFLKNPLLKKIGMIAGIVGVLVALADFVVPPAPNPCVCSGKTDDEAIRCVIMSEARAVNEKNSSLIAKIFNDNAVIFRGSDPQQTWTGPLTYYQPAFQQLTFSQATHSDIELVAVRDQTAYYVSGSSGKYTTKEGQVGQYLNPKPSEHWTLSKNNSACWTITRFEFNAAHLTFSTTK